MNDERQTVFPLPLWVVLVATLLFGCPSSASAAPVFKAEGSNGKPAALSLHDSPCTNPKVVAQLNKIVKPQFISQFKKAILYWDGKLWESCWMEHNEVVYSIDEEGSQFQPVPRTYFMEDGI